MIPTIQNPVFKCSICGKEEQQIGMSTGIPEYWACRECRAKMKKFTLSFTFFEDGYAELAGNCDFCKQYPCRHGNESGDFYGTPMNPLKLPVALRKRWLENLMAFPAAKIVPGKKLVQEKPNTPLREVEAEVEVYWPLGEGGRPAEVYKEIGSVLKSYGCDLMTYKTDGDYHLGWIHRIGDSPPTEKKVKAMDRRDGDGVERRPGNLINWDWKEGRGIMIKDLNEAMEALKVPLHWKLNKDEQDD
jgi:rubredoxin